MENKKEDPIKKYKLSDDVSAKYSFNGPAFNVLVVGQKYGGGKIVASKLTLAKADELVKKGFNRLKMKSSVSKK